MNCPSRSCGRCSHAAYTRSQISRFCSGVIALFFIYLHLPRIRLHFALLPAIWAPIAFAATNRAAVVTELPNKRFVSEKLVPLVFTALQHGSQSHQFTMFPCPSSQAFRIARNRFCGMMFEVYSFGINEYIGADANAITTIGFSGG